MEDHAWNYSNMALVAFLVACTAISMVLAFWLGPAAWGFPKTIAAGLFGGVGGFFCLFANHVLMQQ